MAKTQSFSLKRNGEEAKSPKMYKTRRCFRCIAIPCLIAFTLLLILVNVDYDGEAYLTTPRPPLIRTSRTPSIEPPPPPTAEPCNRPSPITGPAQTSTTTTTKKLPSTTTTTPTTTTRVLTTPTPTTTTTTRMIPTSTTTTTPATTTTTRKPATTATTPTTTMATSRLPRVDRLSASRSVAQPLYCYVDNHDCNITCNGNVADVAKTLVQQQVKCRAQLNVFLRQCVFPQGEMSVNFWSGSFLLRTLSIDDCDLEVIAEGAFEKPAVAGMTRLVIENARLLELNKRTFAGLKAITHFKLLNSRRLKHLHGVSFLTPMAGNLQESAVLQLSGNLSYDPYDWLAGEVAFSKLVYLNLSGNNFQDTLTKRTFENLIEIETLLLARCRIKVIATHTFDHIADSLIYLDLSYNELTFLDWTFLDRSELFHQPLHLILAGNAWRCDCSNYDLMVAIQSDEVVNAPGDAICATPTEWFGFPVADVFLQCEQPTMVPPDSSETTIDDSFETAYSETTKETEDSSTSESSSTDVSHQSSSSTNEPDTTAESLSTIWEDTTSMRTTPQYQNSTPAYTATASQIVTTTPRPTTTTKPTPGTTSTTTTSTTTTSTTTTKYTTIEPNNLISLLCILLDPPLTYNFYVRNYDILFTIQTASPTSVNVFIQSNVDMTLVYFTPDGLIESRDVMRDLTSRRDSACGFRRVVATIIICIEDLQSNSSYVFCMMPKNDSRTSVFNCRSHYLESVPVSEESEIWLYNNDRWLCLSLCVLGLVAFFVVGGVGVYFVLRCRPTWVRGCQRLRRVTDLSNLVYLLPKDEAKAADVEQPYAYSDTDKLAHKSLNERRSIGSWQYTRELLQQQQKQAKSFTNPVNVDQRPPSQPAPAVPSCSAAAQPANSLRNRISSVAEVQEEHEEEHQLRRAQSGDFYEEVL